MNDASVEAPAALQAKVVGVSRRHDSASKHVSGRAIYSDDMPEPLGSLHAYVALSPHAHARIASRDLSAVAATPGVAAVLTARDVPGVNDVGPVFPGDPIFADGLIGSDTKRARFVSRLARQGIAAEKLICPIGLPCIEGKQPAVVAVSVAAQILSMTPHPLPSKRSPPPMPTIARSCGDCVCPPVLGQVRR